MNLLLLGCYFLLSGTLFAHGGHSASYHYEFTGSTIQLEFRIDRSDLAHFELEDECENFETATAFCMMRYLQEHIRVQLNQEEVAFELEGSRTENGYFILNLAADIPPSEAFQLTIANSCFLEFDPEFENQIVLERAGEVKSYRLGYLHRTLVIEDVQQY